jgi:hypothetical protein
MIVDGSSAAAESAAPASVFRNIDENTILLIHSIMAHPYLDRTLRSHSHSYVEFSI